MSQAKGAQKRLEKRKQELKDAAADPRQRKLIFTGQSIELTKNDKSVPMTSAEGNDDVSSRGEIDNLNTNSETETITLTETLNTRSETKSVISTKKQLLLTSVCQLVNFKLMHHQCIRKHRLP